MSFFDDLRRQEAEGLLTAPEYEEFMEPILEEVNTSTQNFELEDVDGEDTDTETEDEMVPTPIQEPVAIGTGLEILKESCGGTLQPNQADSTRARRRAVLKQWQEFMLHRQRQEGVEDDALEIDLQPFLLKRNQDGDVDPNVNWPIVMDFTAHYMRYYCGGSCTQSQFNKLLDWAQETADTNLMDNGFNKQKGVIRGNSALKSMRKKIIEKKADQMQKDNVDLQRNFLRRTEDHQKLAFFEECYVPRTQETKRMDWLLRTEVAAAQAISSMTVQRSEFIRGLRYKFGCQRTIPGLGPKGTVVDMVIANKGKMNQNGHVEGRSLPPHKNPIRDASGHVGVLLVYRHNILQEPFPSFTSYRGSDDDSFCNRPLIRALNHWKSEMSSQVLNKGWNAINRAVGIIVEKVTHQNRVEVTEELFDLGVPDNVAQRMGGHIQQQQGVQKMNESVKASYSLFPPAMGVAAVAGGDPHQPKAFIALWSTVTTGVDSIVRELAPWYYQRRQEVDDAIKKIREKYPPKQANKEMEKSRLYMAEGALDATLLRLKRLVQMAAARAYDTDHKLEADTPPLYLRWGGHPVFQLPVFASEEFQAFVLRMKSVQDMEAQYNIDVPTEVRNEFERVVKDLVVAPIKQTASNHSQLYAEVQQLRTENAQIMNLLFGLTAHLIGDGTEPIPNKWMQCVARKPPALQPAMTEQWRMMSREGQQEHAMEEAAASIPTRTKAGKERRRAPRRNIRDTLGGTTLWSPSLTTAEQYWREFDEGLDGRTPLRELEDQFGPKWRSDTMIKAVPGSQKTSSALKSGWSVRTPIYNYILWKTEIVLPRSSRKSLSDALKDVQDVFDKHMSLNDRPILGAIAKVLRNKLKEDGATQVLLPYPRKKNEVPIKGKSSHE